MTTPAALGFATPSGDDFVNTGDNDITQNANASAAMYDSIRAANAREVFHHDWYVEGAPPSDISMITKSGVYLYPTFAMANAITSPAGKVPLVAGGTLAVVYHSATMRTFTWRTIGASVGNTSFELEVNAGTWGTWRESDAAKVAKVLGYGTFHHDWYSEGAPPSAIDTIVKSGVYVYPTYAMANAVTSPVGKVPLVSPGYLTVVYHNATRRTLTWRTFGATADSEFRTEVTGTGTGQWSPWRESDASRLFSRLESEVDALAESVVSPGPQITRAAAQVTASRARALRKHLSSDPLPAAPVDVSVNGVAGRITWPAVGTWDNLTPIPVLLHFGGVGDTDLVPYEAWASTVASSGIAVARCTFHGDSYGNPQAMADANALIDAVLERAPVAGVIAYGHSMGGVAALNALTTGAVPTITGAIITDGVASMRQRWDGGRAAEITTAYGITPENPYEAATKGHDPMLRAPADFRGVPIGIVGSDADTSVPFTSHGRALAAKLAGHNPVTLVEHTGAHNIGRWNVGPLILSLTADSLGGDLSMPLAII